MWDWRWKIFKEQESHEILKIIGLTEKKITLIQKVYVKQKFILLKK